MTEEEYKIRLDNKRTEQFDSIIGLLQKLVEKAEKKAKAPKVVNVDTWQEGPVKVSINGVPVEEGDELI